MRNEPGGISAIIGIVSASLISGYLNKGTYEPRLVYVRDLNGDGRPDLVVKSKNDTRTLFLQQEDGTYRRLDEIQDEQRSELGRTQSEQQRAIEQKAETLE